MTTGWLLLLLLVVSSQSVDGQSATVNTTCSDGGLISKLESDMKRLLANQEKLLVNQQQLFQQHQTFLDNQQLMFQFLNRLGKFLFSTKYKKLTSSLM